MTTATFNSCLSIDPITGFDHRRYAEFFCHPSSFARSQCFSENYAGKFYEYILV